MRFVVVWYHFDHIKSFKVSIIGENKLRFSKLGRNGETQMKGWPIEHKILLGPVSSKIPQKHPILRGGPAQGKISTEQNGFHHVISHPRNPLEMSFELIF